jgi:hypothetical protein
MMLTWWPFFSRTAATDAMVMGGKTLGFPHALGWIRGGLMRQTRMMHFSSEIRVIGD